MQVGDFSRVIATVRTNPGRKYLLVDGDTLFQRMFYLRGFENLLIDLAERRPEVFSLRDRIVAFLLKRIEMWLGYDVDGLFFRDDWGTQLELMIPPAMWREMFKPSYQRLFAAVHAGGKHVFFHSDGMIRAIIPDLIEIGVNALNAQIPCMDAAELARDFGHRICFVAGADRQHFLPFGTPREVEAHCIQLAELFGRHNGGYIGGGEIGGDVPLGNAEAMLRTFATYRYPRP
jgi:uroporphyrinogen decarboxylase